jgi:hypothetical protein
MHLGVERGVDILQGEDVLSIAHRERSGARSVIESNFLRVGRIDGLLLVRSERGRVAWGQHDVVVSRIVRICYEVDP